MPPPTTYIQVDWTGTGTFSDESAYVLANTISWTRGRSADFSGEAAGELRFDFRNDTDRYSPDRNWLDNPSFASDAAGWLTAAVSTLTATATSLTSVADSGVSGSTAGEAVLTSTSNSGVARPIPFTFRSGVTYAFSVYLKSVSGTTSVRAGIGSFAAPTDIASMTATTITTSWVQYSGTWTPSADRTDAHFFVRTTTGSAATVRIDAAQVNEGATANTWVDGPTRGQLVPGRTVRLYSQVSSTVYPQFTGHIERIVPDPRTKTVGIVVQDPLRALSLKTVTLDTRSRTHRECRIDALNAWGAYPRNAAYNPIFTTDTTGWTGGSGTLTRVTTDSPPTYGAGSTCASYATSGGAATFSQTVPIIGASGELVRLTAWAKHITGTAKARLKVTVGTDTITSDTTQPGAGGDWTRYTVLLKTTAAFLAATIELGQDAGSDETRWGAISFTRGIEDWEYTPAVLDYSAPGANLVADPSMEALPATINWAHARSNKCANGDMETDLTGWDETADSFHGAVVGTQMTRVSTAPYTGSYHIQFTDLTRGFHYAFTDTFYSGVTYVATAYVRVSAGSDSTWDMGIGSNGTPADYAKADLGLTTAYGLKTVSWTPSADRSDVHLYFNGGSVDLYVDSVLVTVDDTGTTEAFTTAWGIGSEADSFSSVTSPAGYSGPGSLEFTTYAVSGSGVAYRGWRAAGRTFYSGIPYRFVARVNSSGSSVSFKMQVGSESVNTDSASATATWNTTWQVYEVTWTPSANRTDVVLAFMVNAATAQTFYVDAVMAYPGSTTLNFEPSYSDLDDEDLRAPSYSAANQTPASLLSAINAVNGTRHWIAPTDTAPYWAYTTESLATYSSKASAGTIDEGISDAQGMEIDREAIDNMIEVNPGGYYINASGVTTANATANPAWGVDRASIQLYGPQPGATISSGLLENVPADATIQQAIADAIIDRYCRPFGRLTVVLVNQFPTQYTRELNDVVTVTASRFGLSSRRMSIASIATQISDANNQWTTTYVLEEMP
jgi:hypothetical protein